MTSRQLSFDMHEESREATIAAAGRTTNQRRQSHPPARPSLRLDPNAPSASMHQPQLPAAGERRSSASPDSPAIEDRDEPRRDLMQILQTQFDSVYELSQDRTTYFLPETLRGVPVAKITEDSPYWLSSWESLDDFLSKEAEEEALKQQYRVQQNLDPGNKSIRRKGKFHQDNMSKYHKIREVFGPDSRYHPNQLVAKRHLPEGGLCAKELMYRLACKISDLTVLQSKGHLAMDPWDFIRWRISIKLTERLRHAGDSAASWIRTIVYKLADKHIDGPRYEDPVIRGAAILAARIQNRLGSYKSREQRMEEGASITNALTRRYGAGSRRVISQPRPKPLSSRNRTHAREEARRERRARLANQPSTYQGVNAYRAGMRTGAARGENQGER